MGVQGKIDLEVVLEKFDLRIALRIGTWLTRFLSNSRVPSNKAKGPLSSAEVRGIQQRQFRAVPRAAEPAAE